VDVAENSTKTYHSATPPEIQSEMDVAEADVQVLRKFISDEEVKETTSSWVPDIGYVHGRSS
jgi:hypothetical protein